MIIEKKINQIKKQIFKKKFLNKIISPGVFN